MRGLVSPMPLRRSYRTKFRVFSGEAHLQPTTDQATNGVVKSCCARQSNSWRRFADAPNSTSYRTTGNSRHRVV